MPLGLLQTSALQGGLSQSPGLPVDPVFFHVNASRTGDTSHRSGVSRSRQIAERFPHGSVAAGFVKEAVCIGTA